MAYKEDVNSPLIFTIGAVSALLAIVVVVGLQSWFMYEEQAEKDQNYAGAVNHQLVDLRKEQQSNITGYRWIDRDKKVAAVPIDEAMKLLIQNKGKLPSTQP